MQKRFGGRALFYFIPQIKRRDQELSFKPLQQGAEILISGPAFIKYPGYGRKELFYPIHRQQNGPQKQPRAQYHSY